MDEDKFDGLTKNESERYKTFIPDYADTFLESFFEFDQERAGGLGFNKSNILNYLEHSFEVDLNNLEKQNENKGIVEFSTGNYPFGGIERFLITLKAFDLVPEECFDGFSVVAFDWVNEFEFNTIELPDRTEEYLKNRK
ncbi:hypothetical protein [Fulvitalea axinellae]